ncbi:SDR family NAD(P)-dependent oxidoreductase [Sinorhizobium meliloti]|uniref:SDR family NAD(P)-dependent oxidoreductase n=1 Tax=Rhizobium meliloti TaxID=382 RepID=UPI003D6492C9
MTDAPRILITGAGSGIGAAIARRIATPGMRLFLHTGTNAEGLRTVAKEVSARGAEVATELGDLSDPTVPGHLVQAARAAFGGLDQIVSNAGRAQRSSFGQLTDADLQTAFDMMPMAFFRLVDAALPDLRTSMQGRVVAVSSFVAHGFGTFLLSPGARHITGQVMHVDGGLLLA